MSKYLIIALSCLIALSVVFGMSFNDSINFMANKISKVSDSALNVVDLITKNDFHINAQDRYAIDYRYVNLGSIDNFEYGHIDKAKYFIKHYMPEYFNRNVSGMKIDAYIDPYYYYLDYGYAASYYPGVILAPFFKDILCIRYKCDITVYDLVDDIIEPNIPNMTFSYEVYVCESSYDHELYNLKYLVRNTGLDGMYDDGVVFEVINSNDYNNIFEFCRWPSVVECRLNGNHIVTEGCAITNVRKADLIESEYPGNLLFYSFLVD